MIHNFLTSKFNFNKFGKILSKYNYQIKSNDILAGTIIGLEPMYGLVDIGLEKVAFLPIEEISLKKIFQPTHLLTINFIGEFLILFINEKTNQIFLSSKEVQYLRLWERIKQLDLKQIVIYGKIKKSIKKGKIINFNGLEFLIYNSYIPKYYRDKKYQNLLLPFKFMEVKDFIHFVYVNSKLAFLNNLNNFLKLNNIYYSCIKSIKPFGIFVNIYGIQCLLHISEISFKKIININNFYKCGDIIKVKIIYKNIELNKISVSIKKI
ncbi:unnamed protein product [Choristocarpus tenellus]|uniref:30S ribosomal protein S1 n=1 Tax=Choristocarpus tenellus TaxID=116065 RepID=UPI002E7A832B|nr:30S ribosomal protein S1 [Choristocarpus tenellus]WAM62303.1 30S ribosomal protein S1 [Choristocarpus tenellus]